MKIIFSKLVNWFFQLNAFLVNAKNIDFMVFSLVQMDMLTRNGLKKFNHSFSD